MKTTKEMIAVMQAYDEGKEIEYRPIYGKHEWKDDDRPKWDWRELEYRVKNTRTYLSYETAEEIVEDMKVHGPMIVINEEYRAILSIFQDQYGYLYVTAFNFSNGGDSSIQFTSEIMLERAKWQDGTPCGKMEE